MATTASCSCGWSKTVSDFFAGKLVRCPCCNAVVEVPRQQTVYTVQWTPPQRAASATAHVPYGYPPYATWKRPPLALVAPVASLRPPAPARPDNDALACLGSATLVLIWLVSLVALGFVVHPVFPGVLGIVTAILVLRGAPAHSSRHSVGGLMLALGFTALIVGLCAVQPAESRGNNQKRNSSMTQYRYTAPKTSPLPEASEYWKQRAEHEAKLHKWIEESRARLRQYDYEYRRRETAPVPRVVPQPPRGEPKRAELDPTDPGDEEQY